MQLKLGNVFFNLKIKNGIIFQHWSKQINANKNVVGAYKSLSVNTVIVKHTILLKIFQLQKI